MQEEKLQYNHVSFSFRGNRNPFMCVYRSRTGKKKSLIRLIIVRQTSISWYYGDPIKGLPGTPVHHSSIVLSDLRGPSIRPSLFHSSLV